MSSDEARHIVTLGLQHRKMIRQNAEREQRLEKYERDMITRCNEHSADAKILRRMEDTDQLSRIQAAARQEARKQIQAAEQAREEAATGAVKRYILTCMAILWLTTWTYLPLWAAVTLVAGLAVFPVVYVFRLYYPFDEALLCQR